MESGAEEKGGWSRRGKWEYSKFFPFQFKLK